MKTITDIEDNIYLFFNSMFKLNRKDFGFEYNEEDPSADDSCYIPERQNYAPRPQVQTVLFYRMEEDNDWGGKIHGTGHYYTNQNKEVITQMRKFNCVTNIFSKTKGMAFNALRYLSAMVQSDRYGELITDSSFFLHLKDVKESINLTSIENSTWVERMQITFVFYFLDEIENSDVQYFVHTPTNLGDTVNSVEKTTILKEGI